jgi:hypothetical protein
MKICEGLELDPKTLNEHARDLRHTPPMTEAWKKAKPKDIVRYIGDQEPRLAGMEGEVRTVTGDKAQVRWAGHPEDKKHDVRDLRVLKGYTKRFKGVPRLS